LRKSRGLKGKLQNSVPCKFVESVSVLPVSSGLQ
jgi:hypothetical protein